MKKRRRKSRRAKKGIYESKKGGPCKYRSGWELLYLQSLDEDPDVIEFWFEPFKIPYVCGRAKKVRNYIPDVLVKRSGCTLLIEIKPLKRVSGRVVQAKADVARRWCQDNNASFEFVTEVDLFKKTPRS